MRGPAQLATYLGIGMAAVGLALIVFAWNGAASLDYVQGQFPFLLSGGLSGLGLVVAGMALLYVQALRTAAAERSRGMAAVNLAMARVVDLVRKSAVERDARGVPVLAVPGALPVEERPAVTADASHEEPELDWNVQLEPPGEDEDATLVAPPDGDATREMPLAGGVETVVAGRSSYHRPDCRLVSNRDDLPAMPRTVADARGLAACRICNP